MTLRVTHKKQGVILVIKEVFCKTQAFVHWLMGMMSTMWCLKNANMVFCKFILYFPLILHLVLAFMVTFVCFLILVHLLPLPNHIFYFHLYVFCSYCFDCLQCLCVYNIFVSIYIMLDSLAFLVLSFAYFYIS